MEDGIGPLKKLQNLIGEPFRSDRNMGVGKDSQLYRGQWPILASSSA